MPDLVKRLDRAELAKRQEKAEKLLQKGKTEGALQEYLGILADDPENDAIRQTAADLYVSLGRNQEAAKLLADLFQRQAAAGDAAKAHIIYKKLARFGTPTPEQTCRFAQLLESSNKKEALEGYEAAYAGFAARSQQREALAVLMKIVALEPNGKNLWRAGELATELGDGKNAAAAFFRVGELEDKSGGKSAPWYERAYKSDPSHPEVALAHGRALLSQDEAEKAIAVLEPLANNPGLANSDVRDLYSRALLAAKRLLEAAPYVWALFEENPSRIHQVAGLLADLIDAQQDARAVEVARKLEEFQRRKGQRREFITMMKDIVEKRRAGPEILEFLVELFNASNREDDYCQTLIKLFELYYAAGNFQKAGDCLDRAAEVDAYEPGHQKRLEMLRGKIDPTRFKAIAERFSSLAGNGPEQKGAGRHEQVNESTLLQDLMLQAEILLQYAMRSKAIERLQRIQELFPHEEEKNEELRRLYMSAGLVPSYGANAAAAPAASPAAIAAMTAPVMASPAPMPSNVGEVAEVNNLTRVTEITRNLYREGNVKGVLSTAANEIGRQWNATRCIAGMRTPGKPPSAVLEYCAPGVAACEVPMTVKLINGLQDLVISRGVMSIPDAVAAPQLADLRDLITAMGIDSLLAVPLLDGPDHVGILILEHHGVPREWRASDIVLLKSIAEQVVMAVHNARLRRLVRNLSVTDEKSGLLKRSSYIDVLLSECRRALQQNTPVAVLLLHFGKASALVKEFGEPAVESLIQQLGQLLLAHIRQNDVAVRYEKTCIALILSDTNEKGAFMAIEKLRSALQGLRWPGRDQPISVTAGLAEAVLRPQFDAVDVVTEVINRVEKALEVARADGGNKVQALAPLLESAAVA